MSLDHLEAFEERAAIMEYMGGLTREEAERRARQIVLGTQPTKHEERMAKIREALKK